MSSNDKYSDEEIEGFINFGKLLKDRRIKLGLNSGEAARKLGMSNTIYSRIESNWRLEIDPSRTPHRISKKTIEKIDNVFDLGPDGYRMMGYIEPYSGDKNYNKINDIPEEGSDKMAWKRLFNHYTRELDSIMLNETDINTKSEIVIDIANLVKKYRKND